MGATLLAPAPSVPFRVRSCRPLAAFFRTKPDHYGDTRMTVRAFAAPRAHGPTFRRGTAACTLRARSSLLPARHSASGSEQRVDEGEEGRRADARRHAGWQLAD